MSACQRQSWAPARRPAFYVRTPSFVYSGAVMNPISSRMIRRSVTGLSLGAIALALAACGGGGETQAPPTVVAAPPPPPLANQFYTMTNDGANAVVHMVRNADGTLAIKDRAATDGAGLNGVKAGTTAAAPDSLVSQHSILVSPDHSTLFAVNAGDNSVSVFAIDQTSGALTLKKANKTLGDTPTSVAFNGGILYVLFQNGPNQLGAYTVQADGTLAQLGLYALPVADMTPTQVVIAPGGGYVVVSAGMAFPLNANGTLGSPVSNTSHIANPFAGAYASPSVYLETDTADMALASYTFNGDGSLSLIGSVVAGEGAPCWLSITPDGKTAFVGNGAGTISSFAIAANGALTLINAKAAQEPSKIAGVPSVAADSWISADGKFMYVSYLGDDKVVAYSVGANGTLGKLNEQAVGTASGLSLQGASGI